MASADFIIKIKSAKGVQTLTDLTHDASVCKLKEVVSQSTGIEPDCIKFLIGFPPKAIKIANDLQMLKDVGIESGDTIIVESVTKDVKVVPEISDVSKELKADSKGDAFDYSIMLRYDVPSDNSCLFSSIFYIMHDGYLDVSEAYQLRNIIADVVSSDLQKYNSAILGKENREYCKWIRDKNSWGGGIELSILSEFYKMEIVAIDISSSNALRFGENNNYERRCFVVFDGIHYDPLYLASGDKTQTVFDVNKIDLMEMAINIAKEAKASRQFTDLNNFTLKCNDCGKHLIGQKDASAHASAFGHTQFGEI